jgi:HSP20 family protein
MVRNRIAHLTHPWSLFNAMQQEIDRQLHQFGVGYGDARDPSFRIYQNADGALVSASVPGVQVEDVDVAVKGSKFNLTIRYKKPETVEGVETLRDETAKTEFSHQFQFPYDLDPQQTQARLVDGILYVELKKHPVEQPVKVEVQAG